MKKHAAIVSKLQKNTDAIRNICILAHVDHGKTTLSDFLLASNGFVSQKNVGQARYLDSRDDEQLRGITMKCSSISLMYRHDPSIYIATGASQIQAEGQEDKTEDKQDSATSSGDSKKKAAALQNVHLINLIDSPGHVDFSSEVSNAVRVSDGALVLVDVVEGLCVQTQAVLRTAWDEGVKPCLVFNKIDRLVTEIKMTPFDAYLHLVRLLETINAYVSTFSTSESMEKIAAAAAARDEKGDGNCDDEDKQFPQPDIQVDDENQLYFAPENGNVVFASAHDHWAFSVPQFAHFYSQKMGMNPKALAKVLWGEYYFNTKKKSVSKKPSAKYNKPMFVQLVLANIWAIYDALLVKKQTAQMNKIIKALGIRVPARELAPKEWRSNLKAIFNRWLPIPKAVLGMVVEHLPSPVEAQRERMPLFWAPAQSFSEAEHSTRDGEHKDAGLEMTRAALNCERNSEHILIYISKMVDENEGSKIDQVAVERKGYVKGRFTDLKIAQAEEAQANAAAAATAAAAHSSSASSLDAQAQTEADENKYLQGIVARRKRGLFPMDDARRFVGFGRVFSGTIAKGKGQVLHIFGPKFDAKNPETFAHHTTVECDDPEVELLVLMGRDVVVVQSVPAGNVFGVRGIGQYLLKTGTISTVATCTPFQEMNYQSKPIVRVALEPVRAADMATFTKGLHLLNHADANVQVVVQASGEHVIAASGELHLERCLTDLKERFAKGLQFRVSKPLVSYRETIKVDNKKAGILSPQEIDLLKVKREQEEAVESNQGQQDANVDRKDGKANNWQGSVDTSAQTKGEEENKFVIVGRTANKLCQVHVQALTLPPLLTNLLMEADPQVLRIMSTLQVEQVRQFREGRTLKYLERLQEDEVNDKVDAQVVDNDEDNDEGEGKEEKDDDLKEGQDDQDDEGSKGDADNEDKWRHYIRPTGHPVLRTSKGKEILRILKTIVQEFQVSSHFSKMDLKHLWSFGPRGCGPNILLNRTKFANFTSLLATIRNENAPHIPDSLSELQEETAFLDVASSFLNGFQLASSAGPLCEEPLMGVCFAIERIEIQPWDTEANGPDPYGLLSGQLISCMKDACRKAFLARPVRLVEAMYHVVFQCTQENVGAMYGVVAQRRGKIIDDEMQDGTQVLLVKAHLPVANSFGFASDVRRKTGGEASPQLVFSHWQIIDQDPNWVPTTEEEIEDFGREHQDHSTFFIVSLIDDVRKRKGLATSEKTVIHAEKQRTLARKK